MNIKKLLKILEEDGEGGDAGGDTGAAVDTSGGMTTGNVGGPPPPPHPAHLHMPGLLYNWLPPYIMGRPLPYSVYGGFDDNRPRRPRKKSKKSHKE